MGRGKQNPRGQSRLREGSRLRGKVEPAAPSTAEVRQQLSRWGIQEATAAQDSGFGAETKGEGEAV